MTKFSSLKAEYNNKLTRNIPNLIINSNHTWEIYSNKHNKEICKFNYTEPFLRKVNKKEQQQAYKQQSVVSYRATNGR